MSTLPIQAPYVPHFSVRTGFNRVVTAVVTVLDVIAEAQRQAEAAHKRFPFADW